MQNKKEDLNKMAKCICCGKTGADYPHYNGGYVCDDCVGAYFTCPACGRVFDINDREHGDNGGNHRNSTRKYEHSPKLFRALRSYGIVRV